MAVTTAVAVLLNLAALATYLVGHTNPWLLGSGQISALIALVVGLRAIGGPTARRSLRPWLLPLAVTTLITLYLTLAIPS